MLDGMAPYERAIAERAGQQLSLITTRQLRDIGLSPPAIRRLTASGRFERFGGHTLGIAGVPSTFERRVMAACLDLGAVASHRTAARLHGLDTRRWNPVPVEVTVPKRTGQTSSELALVHTSTNLRSDDIVIARGIPTTTVARTFLGLAALVPEITEEDVRDLLDVAIRDGRASDKWIWWLLECLRCRGRNGVSTLELMLNDRAGNGKTESWLEREFLRCIDAGGLPRPLVQQRIARRGSFVARVDFLYEPRLILEVSGYFTHSSRKQVDADARRRNRLRAIGYEFKEFTHNHVVKDPAYVIRTVTDALEAMLGSGA
jgi:hypothetical protein